MFCGCAVGTASALRRAYYAGPGNKHSVDYGLLGETIGGTVLFVLSLTFGRSAALLGHETLA